MLGLVSLEPDMYIPGFGLSTTYCYKLLQIAIRRALAQGVSDPHTLNWKKTKELKSCFSIINANNASIVAQTIASCLKSAHARAAVREPPGPVIDCCFHMVAIFFDDFHDTFFFHTTTQHLQKGTQILPKSAGILTLAWFSVIFCTPCF